jgi:apolipoprotein N-acyltransferase
LKIFRKSYEEKSYEDIMSIFHKVALSVLTGVLVSVSFPVYIHGWQLPNLGWIAWVALVPLFLTYRYSSPRAVFLLTFLSSSIWYLTSCFWVVHAMNVYGQVPLWISLLLLALMVAMLASLVALGPLLAIGVTRVFGGESLVWMTVFWVAADFLRNYFPAGGFPWSGLSMSQAGYLPFIQISDLAGTYGLVFVMIWFNYFLAEGILKLRGESITRLVPKTILAAGLIIFMLIYGQVRIGDVRKEMNDSLKVSVALLQGNISQEEKWDPDKALKIVNTYKRAVLGLSETNVDLIVWPESAFPWYVRSDITGINPATLGLSGNFEDVLPITFMGAVTTASEENYYNSGIVFNSDGDIMRRYHKIHLTPFGEYVPYRKALFFARNLTLSSVDFLKGEDASPIVAGGFAFGPLICYEDIFPELSRATVNLGAEFLVNITNNAWFGETSAPYQQLALATFRAVETRRYLVRATNTGISAVIEPTGGVLVKSGMYESATIVAAVGRLSMKTLYARLGDWFAWGCVAYAVFGLAGVVFKVAEKKWRKKWPKN